MQILVDLSILNDLRIIMISLVAMYTTAQALRLANVDARLYTNFLYSNANQYISGLSSKGSHREKNVALFIYTNYFVNKNTTE